MSDGTEVELEGGNLALCLPLSPQSPPPSPLAQAAEADLCSSCGEIYHIQSLCMFGSVLRSSVQACKSVPSVPQQVMTDDAQWELGWGECTLSLW